MEKHHSFLKGEVTMNGAKVLLVDDEVVFTKNMSKLLQTRGYAVTAVNSGEEAINAVQQESFDVLVLDLKMRGMDGLATLRELKKLGLHTKTVILTGHGSIDSAMEARKLGAYDFLPKPCEIGELVAKIEEAWEKKANVSQKEKT
jgi:DNA-binding NtrC family response regulator